MEAIIQKLHKKSLIVVKTITNNPNAKGIEKSKSYGIDVLVLDHREFKSREEYDKALIAKIKELGADLVVLAGFMRILTKVFTRNLKAINIHPSLLPLYKGKDALRRSFEGDEKLAGVTTHFVSDELDGGEIIMQKSFDKGGMSFEEFKEKIHECEYEIFSKTILKVLSME